MTIAGLGLAVLGGLLSGVYGLPMKIVMPSWAWENIWSVYAIFGMVIFPWLYCVATVTNLADTYRSAGTAVFFEVFIFGAAWGCGSVLFGIGLDRVGQSLTFGIVLALASTLGSVLPLVIFHSGRVVSLEATTLVLSSQGAFNGLALLVSVAGLGLLTYAGSLRDAHGKQQQRDEDVQPLLMVSGADDASAGSAKPRRSGSFTSGLLMCILSGVLSSCLNLSFTFGKHIHNAAVRHGNSKYVADNAVWCVGVSAGAIANLLYCVYQLRRNGTSSRYCRVGDGDSSVTSSSSSSSPSSSSSLARNWLLGAGMGLVWFFGNILYGLGALLMGDLGASLGWPVFMVATILTSNGAAVIMGEWSNCGPSALRWLCGGLALLVVAIVLVGLASAVS